METTEKEEKPVRIDPKIPGKSNLTPSIGIVNQPLRTQTFSQNHPALSSDLSNDLTKQQHVNVLPPLPTQNNLPFPPLNQNNFAQQRNLFPQPPYQYSQFSSWKQEERPISTNQPPSWWSNANPVTQNQNYPQENFQQQQQQQQYPYLNPNQNFPNLDYTNTNQTQGYSPWRQQQRPFVGSGFDNQGQNLSMRQVMLKEAVSMPNFGGAGSGRTNMVCILNL